MGGWLCFRWRDWTVQGPRWGAGLHGEDTTRRSLCLERGEESWGWGGWAGRAWGHWRVCSVELMTDRHRGYQSNPPAGLSQRLWRGWGGVAWTVWQGGQFWGGCGNPGEDNGRRPGGEVRRRSRGERLAILDTFWRQNQQRRFGWITGGLKGSQDDFVIPSKHFPFFFCFGNFLPWAPVNIQTVLKARNCKASPSFHRSFVVTLQEIQGNRVAESSPHQEGSISLQPQNPRGHVTCSNHGDDSRREVSSKRRTRQQVMEPWGHKCRSPRNPASWARGPTWRTIKAPWAAASQSGHVWMRLLATSQSEAGANPNQRNCPTDSEKSQIKWLVVIWRHSVLGWFVVQFVTQHKLTDSLEPPNFPKG